MIYIYGLLLSLISGISASNVKKLTTKVKTKTYLLISSWMNLVAMLGVYIILNGSNKVSTLNLNNISVVTVSILILYLLFRIFSNVSQTKLNSHENINVSVLNIVMSGTFFITIAVDVIFGTSYGMMVLIGFILSLLGMLVITVDFKKLKFYFHKDEIVLLIIAYICAGTKPVMAKFLLNYIPISLLCLLESFNYAVIYLIYNRHKINEVKEVDKSLITQFMLQSCICVSCLFLQFKLVADLKIYILTSFATPIFTAIFAYIINKQILSQKTIYGIIVIVAGICISKLGM